MKEEGDDEERNDGKDGPIDQSSPKSEVHDNHPRSDTADHPSDATNRHSENPMDGIAELIGGQTIEKHDRPDKQGQHL